MSAEPSLPLSERLRAALAAVLRGEPAPWPAGPEGDGEGWAAAMPTAIRYHGVAGLLAARQQLLEGWPASVTADLLDQARAGAMWELRHRDVLTRLLAALAEQQVPTLVIKGSALAYSLYQRPADRPRGDTDLLIEKADVPAARRVLDGLGYRAIGAGDSFEWLQEGWNLACPDGTSHAIDLHWAALNAHALVAVLPTAECLGGAQPLPGLGPRALQMDVVRMMIHLCVHRSLHDTAPYLVEGQAYFGGDRLIWSYDIHLLAGRLTTGDWRALAALAVERRVAGACLEGLTAAHADLGTIIPETAVTELRRAAAGDLAYLLSHRALIREWHNVRAMPRLGYRLRYLRSRMMPQAAFLRRKYPRLAGIPLPLLYLVRAADALRRRAVPGAADKLQ